MRKRLVIISLLVLNLCIYNIYAQVLPTASYYADELLTASNFKSISQDSNLVLYISTPKEVLKYNGNSYSKISIPSLKPSDEISFHHANDTAHLLSIKDKGSFYFLKGDTVLHSFIKDQIKFIKIIQDRHFVVTNNDIYLTENNKLLRKYHTVNSITDLETIENQYILGTTDGLQIIDKNFNLQERKGSYINVLELVKGSDKEIYILDKSSIYQYSQAIISREILFEGFEAHSFVKDIEGKLWIGTKKNGLVIYDGIKVSSFKLPEKSKNEGIINLFEDLEGNLWALGSKRIFNINFNGPVKWFNTPDNLGAFSNGDSKIILYSDKVSIFTPIDGLRNYDLPLSINKVLYAYKKDFLWYILMENSTLIINERGVIENQVPHNNPITNLKVINDSLFLVRNNDCNYITNYDLKLHEEVSCENTVDKILAYGNGFYFIDDTKELNYYDFDSKAIDVSQKLDIKYEYELFKDGLLEFDEEHLKYISFQGDTIYYTLSDLEIKDQRILGVKGDSFNAFWVSTEDYIVRIVPTNQKTNSFISGLGKYKLNGYEDSKVINKILLSSDNKNEWLVADNAVMVFNPLKANDNLIPPGIDMQYSKAFNLDYFNNAEDTLLLSGPQKLLNKNHQLRIKPVYINHTLQTNAQFAYRLNNNEWNYQSIEEPIILFNSPSGKNKLDIASVNEQGLFSKKRITINYSVKDAFWKQEWIYYTAGIALILIGFIGYRSIKVSKKNYSSELQDKLNKELEELQKRSHEQILKAQRLKQLNDLIRSQKSELENKNKKIESQKYELKLTNDQIKQQKDLLEETGSKLKASINYAQRIQDALMSTEIEIKNAIDDSFVLFMPRDVVSGDFFWFKKFINSDGDEILIITAVDCTGHGVPGAIVSVVGMNLLNNITELKNIHDPGSILKELNQDIISNLRQSETQVNDGMDMSLITINKTKRKLYFGGAKNPVIYFEGDELKRIKGDKFAIGGQQKEANREYTTHEIDCNDGVERSFYLFSDGYPDQFGGDKGFKFLSKNFKEVLQDIYKKPVLEQKEILYNTIEDWRGEYPQTDDILVIGFKF